MKNTTCPQKVSFDQILFYQSFGTRPEAPATIVPVGVCADGTIWARATDVWIPEEEMRRILAHPEPSLFWYCHCPYVNLLTVIDACRGSDVAARAEQLMTNMSPDLHPMSFHN
jgi:hypothetical protein